MEYKDFKSDLSAIACQIDSYLLAHPFPKSVSPSWLGKEMSSYTKSGGKRLRPALCLWSAALVSDKAELAISVASAAEIFHTWTLVHDDIIDRDATRRGLPTSHTALADFARNEHGSEGASADHFGLSMAILTGDLQQAWALRLITEQAGKDLNSDCALAIIDRLLSHVYPVLLGGEAIDVEFEHREIDSIAPEEILQMLEMKTACLLEFSAQAGIVVGLELNSFDHELVHHAGQFAYNAGLAFQLQDDILGIFADEKELGKPVGSDIAARKVTLLIVETLHLASGQDKKFILDLLGSNSINTEQLNQAAEIIKTCGALTKTQAMMDNYVQQAEIHLAELPNSPAKERLKELAHFMIKRTF
ncbi:polyprenyl synthetase family protein [Lentisphaera profundi]|uniref:Polyprenyl synthetase family protein n=1 Tax=Lentisphaera profundi TaxID=1658616 RepID=A0ABY7VYV8_9BACT|nr:polyprenyl synthetase family protein [Lentisphaera profundi]WDE99091.1 polyprenyl synthetase family protein [Lentisphaera profundi]